MEIGTVRQIDINQEMQDSYLDYAMSVIVSRALPDVRDGLKPVHRRILYAMYDMKLTPDKPYRKSARIVGEVLGKYHPHGDAAVYESMVRMAQDFSMRYPLVDGQGNFGSIDGDEPAAMRYTEARLHPIAMEMLADIEKQTVPFLPNFDGTLEEPAVLPSAIPNFLVNGAAGIAVGMTTNVPPHNLGEVCDALAYMIDHYNDLESITIEELMQFIKGPDFPTGGIVYRYGEEEGSRIDVIKATYAVGRGKFTVQARVHVEPMSRNRSRLVVTELPYQVNKTRLVERIAELVREGRIEGIADLRDESDRQGMRLVIELTRAVDPKEVLAQLYKFTPLQSTFGVHILALVDGEPRTLSLKKALWHYLEHRRDVVRRRTEFDLERARRQAHILEGLLIALDHLDEVIQTIRSSRTADTARENLIRKFKLTEIQAQAILDMALRRLAALEQKKIREEYQQTLANIAYLESLLRDPRKMLGVIKAELMAIKQKFGDERRTQLVERTTELVTARELVQEEDVLVIAAGGKIWRTAWHGRRPDVLPEGADAGLRGAAVAPTTGEVLFITADGRGALIPTHRIPDSFSSAVSLAELLNTQGEIHPTVLVPLPAFSEDEPPAGYLLLTSALGRVKRIAVEDVLSAAGKGLVTLMGLASDDRITAALWTQGTEPVCLCTSQGLVICFEQEEVRPMGLPAAGVAGIKLGEDARVVGMGVTRPDGQILLVTTRGYAKRTPVSEYPMQKRYGAGLLSMRPNTRTGPIAAAGVVSPKDALLLVTEKGRVICHPVAAVPQLPRTAQGRAILKVDNKDPLAGLVVLPPAPGIGAEPAPAETAPARRTRKAPAPPAEKPPAQTGRRKKEAAETAAETGKPAKTSRSRKKTAPAKEPPPASALTAQEKKAEEPTAPKRAKKGASPALEPEQPPPTAPAKKTARKKPAEAAQWNLEIEAPPEAPASSSEEPPAAERKPRRGRAAGKTAEPAETTPPAASKPAGKGKAPARSRIVTSIPGKPPKRGRK
ncbi:MAG: DNA gyrase subunit A [Anaerolineae bacterium]